VPWFIPLACITASILIHRSFGVGGDDGVGFPQATCAATILYATKTTRTCLLHGMTVERCRSGDHYMTHETVPDDGILIAYKVGDEWGQQCPVNLPGRLLQLALSPLRDSRPWCCTSTMPSDKGFDA